MAQAALSLITSLSFLLSLGVLVLRSVEWCHALGGEVASADQPLVVLLDQQGAGETDHGGVVGEDPDDV